MSTVVAGIFRDGTSVQDALARLERDGLARERISVLAAHDSPGKKLVVVERTKAPEGTVVGGALGAVLGAIVGIVATAVAVPGADTVAVAVWIAAFAGVGIGVIVGGLLGALVGRSRPEHEAKLLDQTLSKSGAYAKGGILVGVETDDDAQARRVAGNLEAAGAKTVSSH